MRIFLIGDIVGRPGRMAVKHLVPALRAELQLDVVIANAENVAGGKGITPETMTELLADGVDVVTTGDHVFDQRTALKALENPRVLRPANFPPGTPGAGWLLFERPAAPALAVVNVLGRVFMKPADCPFRAVEAMLAELAGRTPCILVDIHAEATSEKIAMGWAFDGRVSAVLGTHTHVPTADARILPHGTACMTDVGMTGAHASVLGRVTAAVVAHFYTGTPHKFELAEGDVQLHGTVVDLDDSTGRARAITPIARTLPAA
jgi:metallophosphoesterase (TIGR00282 family)